MVTTYSWLFAGLSMTAMVTWWIWAAIKADHYKKYVANVRRYNYQNPVDPEKKSLVRRWPVLVLSIVIFVSAPLASIAISTANGLQNTGIRYETTLTADYISAQNDLGAYIDGFYEQLGVANLESTKLNLILLNAVEGRYAGMDARPGQGQLFSAIGEAYPQLTQLDVYKQIVDYIQTQRAEFQDKQSALLADLQAFDQWRQSGLLNPVLISAMGFPNNALRAQIGNHSLYGAEAEKAMFQVQLPTGAISAYQSGTDNPLTPPSGK